MTQPALSLTEIQFPVIGPRPLNLCGSVKFTKLATAMYDKKFKDTLSFEINGKRFYVMPLDFPYFLGGYGVMSRKRVGQIDNWHVEGDGFLENAPKRIRLSITGFSSDLFISLENV